MTDPSARPTDPNAGGTPASGAIMQGILAFLLPFFLPVSVSAEAARDAIQDLLDGYNPAGPRELGLAGRIVGFSTAAMDNLRLSMGPNLPESRVMRYRSNAVALNRAAERCERALEAIQAKRLATERAAARSAAEAPARSAKAAVPEAPRTVAAPAAAPQPPAPTGDHNAGASTSATAPSAAARNVAVPGAAVPGVTACGAADAGLASAAGAKPGVANPGMKPQHATARPIAIMNAQPAPITHPTLDMDAMKLEAMAMIDSFQAKNGPLTAMARCFGPDPAQAAQAVARAVLASATPPETPRG
jgi:hypothetical protein